MGVRLSVKARGSARSGAPGEERTEEALYEFEQDRILIGRGAGADVALPHRSVSTRHATIEQRQGRYVIVDHGATNGTRVQGTKLVPERPKPLRDGDRIDVGEFVLTWKEGVPVVRSQTAERTASLARRLLRDVLGERAPDAARLVISNGAQAGSSVTIPPPPARLAIGRAETCDLVLDDADASREHVDVIVDLDGVTVRDRGSKNGLSINERRVAEKRLVDRDELVIGATVIVFEDLTSAALRDAEAGPDEPIPEPAIESAPVSEATPADDPDAPTGEPTAEPAKDAAIESIPPKVSTRGSKSAPPRDASSDRAPARIGSGEVIIYVLAALVFLASIAGLFVLLRAE